MIGNKYLIMERNFLVIIYMSSWIINHIKLIYEKSQMYVSMMLRSKIYNFIFFYQQRNL